MNCPLVLPSKNNVTLQAKVHTQSILIYSWVRRKHRGQELTFGKPLVGRDIIPYLYHGHLIWSSQQPSKVMLLLTFILHLKMQFWGQVPEQRKLPKVEKTTFRAKKTSTKGFLRIFSWVQSCAWVWGIIQGQGKGCHTGAGGRICGDHKWPEIVCLPTSQNGKHYTLGGIG